MIRLENVAKIYGPGAGGLLAVDDVSLEVREGEICVLLGPSGCGKTTTMKMVNRLIAPSSGKIFIAGKDTDGVDPVRLRRGIGYVIQQIGLFPNMTVEDNICVVPKLLGWDAARMARRAVELLEIVALDPAVFLKRYPNELSGGQQQRIGVARALAADPPVMLMDEPFGAIDPINREVIQDEFLRMQQKLRKTIMFVSHDIDEAVKMADKIAIFKAGRLEQFGTPNDVLGRPANDFVANFVGADRALKRLRIIKVADAMDSDPLSLRADMVSEQALGALRDERERVVVATDADNAPVGFLPGDSRQAIRSLPVTIKTTEDLRIAMSLMLSHDIDWLACVDANGRFAGTVTRQGIGRRLNGGQ